MVERWLRAFFMASIIIGTLTLTWRIGELHGRPDCLEDELYVPVEARCVHLDNFWMDEDGYIHWTLKDGRPSR